MNYTISGCFRTVLAPRGRGILSFNDSAALAAFLLANADAVKAPAYVMARTL